MRDLLTKAIQSIYDTAGKIEYEIWVVDNASSDNSVDMVRELFPDIHLIENHQNKGFAAANNQAFVRMQGRYALLLNSDAELTPGAVDMLYRFMESQAQAGMACGQLLNPDGTRQNSFANFPDLWSLIINESLLKRLFPKKYPSKYGNYKNPTPVDSCIGACMIVRKTAMDEVGLFDERYFFFMEETDWAKRFSQGGWKVMFVPDARIYHGQGKSAGIRTDARILFYRSRYRYFRKWHQKLYPVSFLIISGRLCINILVNLIALILSFGLIRESKYRLRLYGGLFSWHLKGCP
jgi:GT2 family glycosyltransferase